MLTLGLIFIGTAVVMLASAAAPEHLDPMGMFGLPAVRAVQAAGQASDAPMVSRHVARPTAILSPRAAGARCAQYSAAREAA